MNSVANDLNETVKRFKAIAKQKGIRYVIAASKKDSAEKKIQGDSIEGNSATMNASKSS